MGKRNRTARRRRASGQTIKSASAVAMVPVRESYPGSLPGPLVDRNEWRYDAWDGDFGGFLGTYLDDPRDDGKNRPFIETEQDLWDVQAVGRVLVETNPYARGLMETLCNFVIGTGFKYLAGTKKKRTAPDGLIDAVQDVLDVFVDTNEWCGDFEREIFARSRRDGEFFLRLYADHDSIAKLRVIEPEYIRKPSNDRQIEEYAATRYPYACEWNQPFSWSFGVQTPEDDVVESLGYFIDWSNGGAKCEYVPAYEVEHVKCNVDRNIKRGMSDFFPSRKWLDKALKLLGGTVSGATVQSKIAIIANYEPGVSGDKVAAAQSGAADFTLRRPKESGGTKSTEVSRFEEGTILRAPQGRSYTPGPLGQANAPVYIEVLQAALRATAARWSMPEHMISADASNNNYASILEAGSPFRKAIEAAQVFYKQRFSRLFWKMLRIAFNQRLFERFGLTWVEFQRLIEVQIEAPIVEVTDRTAETSRRQVLNAAGVMSLKTWSAQEGLDYEQEMANGAKPQSSDPLAAGDLPGDAEGQLAGDVAAPAYKDSSRLQFKRNRSSVRQIMDELVAGKTTDAVARVFLRNLGLADSDVDQLIASAADGKVDDEEIATVTESIVVESSGCGTGNGGFKTGNTCASGGGGSGESGRSTSDAVKKSINKSESSAIQDYSTDKFKTINGELRSGKLSGDTKKIVDKIDSALRKAPKHEGTVFRKFEATPELVAKLQPGKEFSDLAFMSTSKDVPKFIPGGSVALQIVGHSGVDVSGISHHGAAEKEVLFPRGTKFEVVKTKQHEHGGLVAILKEVGEAKESLMCGAGCGCRGCATNSDGITPQMVLAEAVRQVWEAYP